MSNRSDRNPSDFTSSNHSSSDADRPYENSGRGRGNYSRDQRGRDPRSGAGGDGNIAKLEANSGSVVIIDQFMLGTAQFLKRIGYFLTGESSPVDERSFIEELIPAAKAFGGAVLKVAPGAYGVYRDPASALMLIAPEESLRDPAPEEADRGPGGAEDSADDSGDDENFGNRIDRHDEPRRSYAPANRGPGSAAGRLVGDRASNGEPISRVWVETRCLVFIDAHHLRDPELIHRYKDLRDKRDDKAARDLLRQYGAAVRYGFNRRGDKLGVYQLKQPGTFGLWPAASSVSVDRSAGEATGSAE